MTPKKLHRSRFPTLATACRSLGLVFILIFNPMMGCAEPRPQAVVPKSAHDFGEVVRDQELSHTFTIKNAGQAPLQILEVDPDCACTVPSYDREIAPGKSGKITLALKPYSVSKNFSKKTKIRFNDPDKPEILLVLTGYARPLIEVVPGHVIRFRGGVDEEHRAELRFTSNHAQPWEIKSVQTNIPDKIEVDLKTEEPGKKYALVVKNKAQEPGRYAGRIFLITTVQRQLRLVVRVFADLSEFAVSQP